MKTAPLFPIHNHPGSLLVNYPLFDILIASINYFFEHHKTLIQYFQIVCNNFVRIQAQLAQGWTTLFSGRDKYIQQQTNFTTQRRVKDPANSVIHRLHQLAAGY